MGFVGRVDLVKIVVVDFAVMPTKRRSQDNVWSCNRVNERNDILK